MRISDWSSDVCSSDLVEFAGDGVAVAAAELGRVGSVVGEDAQAAHGGGSGGEIQPTKAWRRRHGHGGNAVVRRSGLRPRRPPTSGAARTLGARGVGGVAPTYGLTRHGSARMRVSGYGASGRRRDRKSTRLNSRH